MSLQTDRYTAQLKRRYRKEWRFQLYGKLAIGLVLAMLLWLGVTVFGLGVPAFTAIHGSGDAASAAQSLEPFLKEQRLDASILTRTDSADPQRAGTKTAWIGSFFMVFIAAFFAIPGGIVSAIYLQEFAPRSGWGGRASRALDVVINNLAAVPAIVYGLLGLAVFINGFGLARSAVLTGGLVLGLRIFPTIIIGCRGALASVPDTIVDGALSLGASRMQAIFGHKLPLAAPGIVTASLLAVAQALGEAAPLLLIGMVAYISSAPSGLSDPATALPVQIFMWADGTDAAWTERAAAAVILLLVFLIVVNGLAVWLRARLSRGRSL